MRIVSGEFGGRVLHVPAGLKLRPTTDKSKEALFNVLANLLDFERLKMLELFAGTGAIGLEARSRGALVKMVEKNYKQANCIRQFVHDLNISAGVNIIQTDAVAFVKKCAENFDLIFADPPYDLPFQHEMIHDILERELLAPKGWLVWEHRSGLDFGNLNPQMVKTYGESSFSFFQTIAV